MREQFHAALVAALTPPKGALEKLRDEAAAELTKHRELEEQIYALRVELDEQLRTRQEAIRVIEHTHATCYNAAQEAKQRASELERFDKLQKGIAHILTKTEKSLADPTLPLEELIELTGDYAPVFSHISLMHSMAEFGLSVTTKPLGPSCDIWGGTFLPEGKTGIRVVLKATIIVNQLSRSVQIASLSLSRAYTPPGETPFINDSTPALHTNQSRQGETVCLGSFSSAITVALASDDLLCAVEEMVRYLLSPNLFESYTPLTVYLGTLRNPWLLPAHPADVPHLYMTDDTGYLTPEREEAACAHCGAILSRLYIRACRLCMDCCGKAHTPDALRGQGILGTRCRIK